MTPLRVFICNAPADKRLREKLDKLLAPLKRRFPTVEWSDCEISAGREWYTEIGKRLNAADLILLLISPDLLSSSHFYAIAMHQVVARHHAGATVIPILLSPVITDIPLMSDHNVQPLPRNAIPITSWARQDRALAEVAMGIREAIEARVSTHQEAAPAESVPLEARPIPPYYVYISDSKLGMLTQQWHREDIAPPLNRYQALDTLLATLRRAGQIGALESQKPYVAGRLLMRWGIVEWGVRVPVAFFFAQETSSILIMAGSAYHLLDIPATKYTFSPEMIGASGSALPSILGAIEFAANQRLPSWVEGIGRSSDYLFIAGFVREKFIDRVGITSLPMNFPAQRFQFVARVLQRLPHPSEQQSRTLLADPRLSKRDKRDIQEILSDTRDILICSPLSIILDDEQGGC